MHIPKIDLAFLNPFGSRLGREVDRLLQHQGPLRGLSLNELDNHLLQTVQAMYRQPDRNLEGEFRMAFTSAQRHALSQAEAADLVSAIEDATNQVAWNPEVGKFITETAVWKLLGETLKPGHTLEDATKIAGYSLNFLLGIDTAPSILDLRLGFLASRRSRQGDAYVSSLERIVLKAYQQGMLGDPNTLDKLIAQAGGWENFQRILIRNGIELS